MPLLWQLWSPTWHFDDATFERTAAAFDNPDFVDVVIHSYRHRFGLVPGDPALTDVETALALRPPVTVPALTFDGGDDGVRPPAMPSQQGCHFTAARTHVVVPGVGHNMPQEAPGVFVDAVLSLGARRMAGSPGLTALAYAAGSTRRPEPWPTTPSTGRSTGACSRSPSTGRRS